MGYEVKMFIGELGGHTTDNGRPFLTIAMVDICGPGGGDVSRLSEVKASEEFEPAYFFEFDGNTRVTKDHYDKRLAILDPQTVLIALEKDNKRHSYRRFTVAIATLKAIMTDFQHERIGVVFYGY